MNYHSTFAQTHYHSYQRYNAQIQCYKQMMDAELALELALELAEAELALEWDMLRSHQTESNTNHQHIDRCR